MGGSLIHKRTDLIPQNSEFQILGLEGNLVMLEVTEDIIKSSTARSGGFQDLLGTLSGEILGPRLPRLGVLSVII